jgi:capsular exopolysaccharide synthesis family protein
LIACLKIRRIKDMDKYLEPRQIISTLFRWWWILVIVPAIAVAIGYAVTKSQTRVYEATATVMVGGFTQTPQISRDDIIAREVFTQSYAEMALRQPVLDGVVETLGLDFPWVELKDIVHVAIVEGAPLIEVGAEASNPQTAEAIAGELANQLIRLSQDQGDESSSRQFVEQEVDSLQIRIEKGRQRLATLEAQVTQKIPADELNQLKLEIDTLQRFVADWEDTYSRLLVLLGANGSQNSLTIIEEARANPEPVSPRKTLNLVISFCLGLVLAVGTVFAIDLFDDRIRTGEELKQKLGLNHLGTVTRMKGKDYDGKLVAGQNPSYGTALFYRKILENIGLTGRAERRVKSLLITSPRLREGKSVTVSNLGIMIARSGLRTVLVDVDWKKPTQHHLFQVPNEVGLMDLLTNSELITKEHLRDTGLQNLQVLTTGNLPDNPIEALQADRMKKILADLAKVSDVVLLDSPSTAIMESAVLFNLVDGVILVIDSGRTTMAAAKQSLLSLNLTGGKLLGGILNRSPSY